MNPIETLNGAFQAAKLAMSAASAVKNADLNLQLAELMQKLAELQVDFSSLLLENTDLKKQLREERDANQNPPELDGDVYFFGKDFGPCCTQCWDAAKKTVLLKEFSAAWQNMYRGGKPYYCPTCKTEHHGEEAGS